MEPLQPANILRQIPGHAVDRRAMGRVFRVREEDLVGVAEEDIGLV
jgi:hypothetical protein